MKEATDSGAYKSDIEVIIHVAKSLGYGVSTEEVERSIAAFEEMDPEEMEQVAGGESDSKCHMVFGWFDGAEDEYGHSVWCYTAWHCKRSLCIQVQKASW